MSDAIFVIKCFVVAVGLAFMMQMKISGITIESRMDSYIRKSSVVAHLQDAAAGGARIAQESYFSIKNFVLDSTRSFRQDEPKGNH